MSSAKLTIVLSLLVLVPTGGCKKEVADFCEQSSDCDDLGKPFCDVAGEYAESTFIGKTCIPFPEDPTKDFCLSDPECPSSAPVCGDDRVCRGCSASAECGESAPYCDVAGGTCLACEPDRFQRCDGTDLVVCNATGTGEDVTACSTSCDATAMRCDDCTPDDFLGCTDGSTASICSSTGIPTDTPCAYACNATDMRCEQCEPSTEACTGGNHVVCDAVGGVSLDETCALGCSPSTQTTCADIDPSNGLAQYLDMTASASPLSLTGNSTIDTNTGEVINGGTGSAVSVINFLGGPGANIRVFVVKSLMIQGAVTATGIRPFAIVADADIAIEGRLIAAATGAAGGPGAIAPASGDPCEGGPGQTGAAGEPTEALNTGAGGGSFGTVGGDGGGLENTSLGGVLAGGTRGAWSPAVADTLAPLEPLRGGCPGGIVRPDGSGPGGGGGGAVQLVSRTRIHFLNGGEINVGGGGGYGLGIVGSNGGGGGGSGGGILLEAPEITTTGSSLLLSIGGGGGCGAEDDSLGGSQADGADGKDLDPATNEAPGGTCDTDGLDASGGDGNSMDGTALSAVAITGNNPRGTGAGAGGNGIVRENVLSPDGSSSSVVIGSWSNGPLDLR